MGTGKKKIEIKKIEKYSARMVTFSKRRQGLFKKADQYAAKTGYHVAILAFSPAGKPFIHGSPCFDTVIEKFVSKNRQDGTVIGNELLLNDFGKEQLNVFDEEGTQEERTVISGGEHRDRTVIGEELLKDFDEDGTQEVVTAISGGEEEGGVVSEMFSRLEGRIRSSENVEELLEVKSVLEEMREKVLRRLNYMQEDDFVASLFSCDFRDWPLQLQPWFGLPD